MKEPHYFEHKFIIPMNKLNLIRSFLNFHFKLTQQHNNTTNHTIYFDTKNQLNSYKQKEYSEHTKIKYRLRWYDQLNQSPLFCECKINKNEMRTKKRHQIKNDIAKSLNNRSILRWNININLSSLLKSGFDQATHREALWPIIHCTYQRERYIQKDSGLRVNLDTQIKIDDYSPFIFKKHRRSIKLNNYVILELKHEDLSVFDKYKLILKRYNIEKATFSKYKTLIDHIIN